MLLVSFYPPEIIKNPCDFMKKRLQYRRFPVTFAKFLKTLNIENLRVTAYELLL